MSQPNNYPSVHESGLLLSEIDEPPIKDQSLLVTDFEELGSKPIRMGGKLGKLVGRAVYYDFAAGGSRYTVQRAIPVFGFDDGRVDADRVINKTPAFCTRFDSGINEIMTNDAVNAGFTVNTISQETDSGPCPRVDITAQNHLAIADYLQHLHSPDGLGIDKVVYDEEGASRGYIISVNKSRITHMLGRITGNLDVIVPVYHHANSALKDTFLYAKMIPTEGKSLVQMLNKNPSILPVLIDTVVTRPADIIHAAKSIGVLRSANTQRAIAGLNPEQEGTVSIAKNDGFRQTRALDYAFRRFPNIERQLSEGTHVSFIDKEGQEAYRTRTLARALRLAASDHTTAA